MTTKRIDLKSFMNQQYLCESLTMSEVEKLLEYRRFRDLAVRLGELAGEREDWYGRLVKPLGGAGDYDEDDDGYLEVSLYDLTKAVLKLTLHARTCLQQSYVQAPY